MSCVGNRPKSYATKPFKTGRSRMTIEQEKIPLTSSPDEKQDLKKNHWWRSVVVNTWNVAFACYADVASSDQVEF